MRVVSSDLAPDCDDAVAAATCQLPHFLDAIFSSPSSDPGDSSDSWHHRLGGRCGGQLSDRGGGGLLDHDIVAGHISRQ
jgi:hypothetical protein